MESIRDALQSNWIAPVGPHVEAFELGLASVLKTGHVIAVNSGTSAIHLGLLALGVAAGDEVLCSSLTFCASANPVIYCGAKPVFVDSEKDTWNIDPMLLEEALNDRIKKTGKAPKAIIVVHLYGMPARMDEIMKISRKYDVPVLEDAAEALGSAFHNKPMGTIGKIGVVSFNGNKIITTSSGGALFSDDATLVDRARYFRQEAREPKPYYEHREVGYNYRFSNILAALGRSQLKALGERVKTKREIFSFYHEALRNYSGISFQSESGNSYSNRWLTSMIVDQSKTSAESIRLALERENIESRLLWKPMHLQPVFAACAAYVNGVSENLFHHGLCLPSGTNLSHDDLNRITKVIQQQF